MEVADWLGMLNLDQYAPQFLDHHVTLDLLPSLTANDLKELGVHSVGHRRRLINAIALLRESGGASALQKTGSPTGGQREDGSGERRQVAVLFADLTGYTELSNLLDAEEVENILKTFFEVADAAIIGHGGIIDKHIGDCVMGLFGAPVAHGNDAERAVLAGLNIRDSMPDLCKRLGREIGVHVGIASGEVVASEVGSARHKAYTVTGETVNLASRLTDRARSGEVLLSSSVYRALQDRLHCEDAGEIDVKGFAASVRAWRLLGKRHFPGIRRAFVGRTSELHQFAAAMKTCQEVARGRVIYVRGEAGLGKTRLIEEFQQYARRSGFTSHSSLVLDFGAESGRDALRTLIRSIVLEDEPDDDDANMSTKVRALIETSQIGADHTACLYDLLNLPQPVQFRALYDAMDVGTRNRGVSVTIKEVIAGAARAKPLLIVIEDLHWADDSILTGVSAIAEVASELPLLLVLTSRNVGDPLTRGWRPRGPILTLDLAPLHREEALALARNVFEQMNPFAMNCLERAAGNPLFLEQLLLDVGEHPEDAVPDSIQSLVQARMDRLAPPDKLALQAASAFGQRFSLGGLRGLIENQSYVPSSLLEQGLLRQYGDELLFGHALIRDAVYSTLLRSRRRELHKRAALWFADRDLGLRAQHLDRADDAMAPEAYHLAARSEAARYRYESALALIDRGASLARDPQDRFALACYRGELLLDMGEVEQAQTAYETALQQAQDEKDRCRAWLGMAAVRRLTDDLEGAFADVQRAEKAASNLRLIAEEARAHFLHGNLLFPRGDLEGCLREHRRSLELARSAESAELEAAALGGIGDAEYVRGKMLSAQKHFTQCIDLSRRHGFGRIEVANLPMSAFMRLFSGETRAALAEALAAIEMASKVGHRRAQAVAHHAAYYARHSLGEFAAAQTNVDAALELARQLKSRRFEAEALAFGAELDRLAGRHERALAAISGALAISAETGMAYLGPVYYAILALVEENESPRRTALAEGEALLSGNVVAHNHLFFRKDAIEACILLHDWGEAERHAEALEEYIGAESLPWARFVVARARLFVAFGRGRLDCNLEHELKRLDLEGDRLGIRLPSIRNVLANRPTN